MSLLARLSLSYEVYACMYVCMYVAVLYVLRLYEVVLAASDREDLYQATVERIQRYTGISTYNYIYIHTYIHICASRVVEVVGSGYSSDLLARHMPEWLEFITQRSVVITPLCLPACLPNLSHLIILRSLLH